MSSEGRSNSKERFESNAEVDQNEHYGHTQIKHMVQKKVSSPEQSHATESRKSMRMAPLTVPAANIVRIHTALALLAFTTTLVLGCTLHFRRIVKNGVAGYPQEWFPSVSATIGDWYPERSLFHILIALNSGPRFVLVFLQYLINRSSHPSLSIIVFFSGIIRTLSCGGWVYITSEDDHDAHDILMITYIVCNIPWMLGGIICTPKGERWAVQRKRRIFYTSAFFGLIVPMVYFFIQHKVHHIPGAYTHYAFFEWGLIFTDILYDSVSKFDFACAKIEISISAETTSFSTRDNKSSLQKAVNDTQIDQPPQPQVIKQTLKSTPQTGNFLYSLFRENRHQLSAVSDIYLSYIFWSIYTSLIPSLFYFSVWELGIAGAELALLALLSPCLLGSPLIKNYLSTRSGRVTLHFLCLLGLIAYKLPKPGQRLLLVFFASIFACLGISVDLADLSDTSPATHSIYLGLGLILSSFLKDISYGNNPIWPMLDERSGGYNKTGILLAILAITELAIRPRAIANEKVITRDPTPGHRKPTWLTSSIALGSLIFSLHCFLTDSSTLISWTWTGYPIKGPVPHTHGILTLLAQCIGLGIPVTNSSIERLLSSPIWLAFGALSSYVLYSYSDWLGYFGGLGLAIFLMSIIPRVVIDASFHEQAGKVYFTAFLVSILFYLANVWTVAYAFVPAGWILRERTDLVLFAQIAALSPAFSWPNKSGCGTQLLEISLLPRFKALVFSILAILVALIGIATVVKAPSVSPQPLRPGPRIVRAGIWTVHFGMDNEGRDSQRAMKDLIRDMELDVVGLLETDLHRPVYGNRDLTRVIVEELGYYVDLGPGPNKHTWGAVLLSKFPIINSTHHLLPSPHGELAPAISTYLNVFGTEVMVVVAHNGQEEDPLDRELQSKELSRILASSYPNPAIFLGYVITKPHAPRPAPYDFFIEDGKMHDIDEDDRDRWCEYIFYRGLYRTSYMRMSRGKVTDTELQAGQFVVPRFGYGVTNESKAARYLRNYKETLGEAHWFPMEYYGDEKSGGKNGHFYHVFGTPLYYNIPEGAIL